MRFLLLAMLLPACTASLGDDDREPTTAAPLAIAGPAESELFRLTNEARAAAGLPALKPYWDLVDDARAQSERMRLHGSLYHNPELASVTTVAWTKLGENVGVGGSASSLHDAFMRSPAHRANVMGGYDYVGVGAIQDGARLWVALVFMASDIDGLERGLPPFHDDEGNPHERAIQKIAEARITVGCNPPTNDRYCPGDVVTRAQMATFLVRGLHLPPSADDRFVDDDGHWAEASIQALAAARITLGCNPPVNDRFCPDQVVTRAEMAAFLARALDLPPGPAGRFSDDDGHWAEGAIEAIAHAGITVGCGGDRYCPDEPVTRDQMASFLARAFGL